ncbi:MAG: acyl-CoA dehydrogenase family protein [Hydrogenophaga sp.]|uniref:acyl-CoA dehydrogenase family protein n=1 Tax=Hydrogenophaga sp. TaxID=1904254 RepID=UPI002727D787|nr:acyl-CoA dehydrogenase family protein [Hydrogenophaga sp.]MDO9482991.1 acyl-CoA dehydrogenase family protein [Hydrogenophaga sp.]MDP3345824.1 acyl-CoA dehydrogenase family protein [Hydrogenophaga sp.]MDP3808275.1 acyl-CoA dehydrogenase family protein [Hydrogenophaga sp.]
MKLQFSAADEAFRLEVRAFVKDKLPADIRRKVELGLRLEHADYVTWFRILEARGWLTPGWPVEHGGPGWSHVQRYIFDEETLLGGAPRIIASGIQMLGPVLHAFGTEEQKRQYLPDIRQSNTWWAQGFSEPGAGSDLATVRTTAVLEPDGKHFVVNGHKVWTSYAHWCSMMFALVRTDPHASKPQEGISFLLIDMASPGLTVRPIRMLEGGTDLNECYLDNVRVPVDNLVGELHKGWSYGKYLLGHERTGIAGIGSCKQQLARARQLAQQQGLGDDPVLQARLAQFDVELMALEFTALRLLSDHQQSRTPGVEASMLKVRGTELRQAIFEALVDIAGPDAVPFSLEAQSLEHLDEAVTDPTLVALAANCLDARKLTIYGGTNEVQRNLIARATLDAF